MGEALLAQKRDDALRLAEAIDAEQMIAIRVLRDGNDEAGDFLVGWFMAEHGQREGGFGDEHIARHGFEGRAGGVETALIITRSDDALALPFEQDLRGTKDVACGDKAHGNAVDIVRLVIAGGLVIVVLAEAQFRMWRDRRRGRSERDQNGRG